MNIDLEPMARALDGLIEELYKKRMGFALVVFEFNTDKGVADYISNAQREDMIKVLREKADILEAGLDIPKIIGNA